MLEAFESGSSRDFKQRYQNSYGFFTNPDTKKRTLVLMASVGTDKATFLDKNDNRYDAIADQGNVFEFIPVKKKLFVCLDRLMYIRRRPARMWARGVNIQNTQLTDLSKGVEDTTLTFKYVIGAFLNEDYAPVQEVRKLENKEINSVALSDMFGVCQTQLYLYNLPVGSFLCDRKEIIMDNNMFKQEAEDLMKSLALNYKVSTKNV